MENKIIKNNAISAYLLFGISVIFLFIKNNKNIANDFVKWHTKSAIFIHFLMILDIIFFRFYKVWSGFFILNYEVSNIIFMWILIFLFLALFLWIYKAYKWETFSTKEIIKIKNEKNLLDVNKDWNFWEKDKLTIILSYIPFLWQIFSSKYDKHETIKEILKVNVFVTFILSLLFINNYNNLSQILLLIYFIFVAFIGVNLFSRSELVSINLPNYLKFSEICLHTKVLAIYLKKYLSWKFIEYKIILEEKRKEEELKDLKIFEENKNLDDFKWPKKIIYLPIFNLFLIFFKKTKLETHKKNALTINFLLITALILIFVFNIFSIKILILFLFPISYWIGNIDKINYRIPLIYGIYETYTNFIKFFQKTKKFIKEKKNETNELKIKVWEKIENKE